MNNLTDLLLSRLKTSGPKKALAYDLRWFLPEESEDALPIRSETSKKSPNTWLSLTWVEFAARVRHVAAGLLSIGLKKGHRFAFFTHPHPDALIVETAAICIGATCIPLCPDAPKVFIQEVLQKSHAGFLLVPGQSAWEKIIDMLYQLPDLQHVLTLFPVRGDSESQIELSVVERRGIDGLKRAKMYGPDAPEGDLLEHAGRNIEMDRDAYLLHTMGSLSAGAGSLRIVPITHQELLRAANQLQVVFQNQIPANASVFEILPQGHYSRCLSWVMHLSLGYELHYCGFKNFNPDILLPLKPQCLLTIPQILEQWCKTLPESEGLAKLRKKFSKSALAEPELFSEFPGKKLKVGELRELLGKDFRTLLTTGSYLRPELSALFSRLGVNVFDIYGLCEAGGAVAVNLESDADPEALGAPLAGFELSLSEHTEIQIRGEGLCRGYGYTDESGPRAVKPFKDSWLQTGDLAKMGTPTPCFMERKKDLLITAAGKIIAPKKLEALFANSALITHAVVFGHNRSFLTALFDLNQHAIKEWLGLEGLLQEERWFENGDLRSLLQNIVDSVNRGLEPYEQIRHFAILPRALSAEKNEINLVCEPVRKNIQDNHSAIIEQLYESEYRTMLSSEVT